MVEELTTYGVDSGLAGSRFFVNRFMGHDRDQDLGLKGFGFEISGFGFWVEQAARIC